MGFPPAILNDLRVNTKFTRFLESQTQINVHRDIFYSQDGEGKSVPKLSKSTRSTRDVIYT